MSENSEDMWKSKDLTVEQDFQEIKHIAKSFHSIFFSLSPPSGCSHTYRISHKEHTQDTIILKCMTQDLFIYPHLYLFYSKVFSARFPSGKLTAWTALQALSHVQWRLFFEKNWICLMIHKILHLKCIKIDCSCAFAKWLKKDISKYFWYFCT